MQRWYPGEGKAQGSFIPRDLSGHCMYIKIQDRNPLSPPNLQYSWLAYPDSGSEADRPEDSPQPIGRLGRVSPSPARHHIRHEISQITVWICQVQQQWNVRAESLTTEPSRLRLLELAGALPEFRDGHEEPWPHLPCPLPLSHPIAWLTSSLASRPSPGQPHLYRSPHANTRLEYSHYMADLLQLGWSATTVPVPT